MVKTRPRDYALRAFDSADARILPIEMSSSRSLSVSPLRLYWARPATLGLCCPFLTLQLSASGDKAGWTLAPTGPKGVKPLLEAEFPAR